MRPKDRLLRRGIPKTAIRKGLEDWSDGLSRWENIWTAIVVLGLGFEVAASLARFLPHEVFDLIWPHSTTLRDIGDAMVFGGVLGELIVSSKSTKVETDLREENDRLILEANERATKAEERIAELQFLAEREASARVKLQSTMLRLTVTRALGLDEEKQAIDILRKYAGQRFALRIGSEDELATISHNAERLFFASQLERIVLAAGWEKSNTVTLPSQEVRKGVTIFSAGNATSEAAAALAGILHPLQIHCALSFVRDTETLTPLVIGVGLL